MHPNAREFWQWVEHSDIGIDVYLDTTFEIERVMQFSVTPMKVLCDSQGVMLWADPPREAGDDRVRFWEDLEYAMASR